jgi:hypothetical protein
LEKFFVIIGVGCVGVGSGSLVVVGGSRGVVGGGVVELWKY